MKNLVKRLLVQFVMKYARRLVVEELITAFRRWEIKDPEVARITMEGLNHLALRTDNTIDNKIISEVNYRLRK